MAKVITNKEVTKKVPFRGLVNIGTRLEMLFFGLIVMVAISTVLINYNFLQTIQLDNDISNQTDQVIKNSDRNYHATVNSTAALFAKGNERGNQTKAFFTDMINKIGNTTKDIANESHAIHSTHIKLMDSVNKLLNQTAISNSSEAEKAGFQQAERNYKALQQKISTDLDLLTFK